jgi:hypothetical protein
LRHIKVESFRAVTFLTMRPFIFRCPVTNLNVQHQLDDNSDIRENEYEGIICNACARLHFLNRKTGKLLGQDEG